MTAVVLESSMGSEYDDSPTSYEFPVRYLKYFKRAPGEPIYVVLYEPRGDDGRGRMKYVGWAEVAGDPVPTGRKAANGQALYVVHYTEPAREFDIQVPREILGEAVEGWLNKYPRGRQRNVATFGRAVRSLEANDLVKIFQFAGARLVEARSDVIDLRERVAVLSNELRRSEQFRRLVIATYQQQCAVTGFSLGSVAITKSQGLLDAAHIRPVASSGSDRVTNGMPLTPTLHRMFDAGLFTATYRDGVPRIAVSPRLESRMVESPDGRFRLKVENGHPLLLPAHRQDWPDPRQLDYHREKIFLAE